jgi:hypothetical protein
MNSRVIHRLVGGLVAFAALALLVPSLALGAIRPDNRSGPLGAAPVTLVGNSDDVFMRAVTRHQTSVGQFRPDDRSGPLGAEPITIASHTVAVSAPATTASSGSFQWGDAAVGAGSVLAFCMLVLIAVTLQRQHRRSAVAH